MKNLYTGEYNETGKAGVITEVKGHRTLVSIDGVPAVKKYCEWTGKTEEEVAGGNLLAATIFAPLGVKDPVGSVTAIRHPMAANDDLSMNIGANLAEGTAVIRMEATVDELIDGAVKTLKDLNKENYGTISTQVTKAGGAEQYLRNVFGDNFDKYLNVFLSDKYTEIFCNWNEKMKENCDGEPDWDFQYR